jgi:hypothetical protein
MSGYLLLALGIVGLACLPPTVYLCAKLAAYGLLQGRLKFYRDNFPEWTQTNTGDNHRGHTESERTA